MTRPGGWPPDGRRTTFVAVAGVRLPVRTASFVPDGELDRFVRVGPGVLLIDDHAPVDQLLAPVFGERLRQEG